MAKQYQLHVLIDGSLRDAIAHTARAEGISVSDLIRSTLASSCDRRSRIAASLGLRWSATDDEIATELQAALQNLSPIESAAARGLTVDQAFSYTAGREGKKRKNGARPSAQTSGSKPAPAAWRNDLRSRIAAAPVALTGATGQPLLRSSKADSLPSEFILFTRGVNDSANGSVLFDARAAKLVLEQAKRHGVDFMIDVEHRSVFSRDETSADAMGWFTPEDRSGELWATRISWTDVGAERLRSRRQRYTSPAFFCSEFDEKHQVPRVTSLLNCAICSMPATYQIAPLVASAAHGRAQ